MLIRILILFFFKKKKHLINEKTNKITNFGNKNIELSILGTSINSKGYKFLSIKLVPLLSVTKIVSKLFFK